MLVKATSIGANFRDGFNSMQLETDIEKVMERYRLLLAGKYVLSGKPIQTDGRLYLADQSMYPDFALWSSAFIRLTRVMPNISSANCLTALVVVNYWEKGRIPDIQRDLVGCFKSQSANLSIQEGKAHPSLFIDGAEFQLP